MGAYVTHEVSGQRVMTMTERDNMLTSIIFKTRIEPCRWNVCAEVGHFCRKGFRSPAATCDQMRFHFKIISPQITAPLSVVPRNIPLTGLLEQMPRSEDRRASA